MMNGYHVPFDIRKNPSEFRSEIPGLSFNSERILPKCILIVDDDFRVAKSMSGFLHSLGYETFLATTGKKGLKVVEAYSVDGIVLDLEMPGMNGWTMLDELRWRHHSMPVVVMSDKADPRCVQNLLNEGAQGYLVKPFNLQSVERIFRRVFGTIPSSSNSKVVKRQQTIPYQVVNGL